MPFWRLWYNDLGLMGKDLGLKETGLRVSPNLTEDAH